MYHNDKILFTLTTLRGDIGKCVILLIVAYRWARGCPT